MMAEEKKISTVEEAENASEISGEAVAEEPAAEAVEVEAVAEEPAAEAVAEEPAAEAVEVEAVAEEPAAEAVEVEAVAEEPAAEADEESEIEKKLQAAEDNITRAKEEHRARKSESDKAHKQTEAEAEARIEETEKKLQEDERLAQLVIEQKQAALDYAFNYRQKLMKDRQKAMSAAKLRERQEREAAEAAAREEKAKEIAALLERERSEAKERGEKATELLNRVTKCAIVDENGNLVLVDRLELAKGKLDDKSEPEETKAPEEVKEPAAEAVKETPKEAPAPVENTANAAPVYGFNSEIAREEAARREVDDFLAGEIVTGADEGKFVLNITDDKMIVTLTSEDDPLISNVDNAIPVETYSREVAIAEAQHKYIIDTIRANGEAAREQLRLVMEEEQRRFDHEIAALMAHSGEVAALHAERRQEVIDKISAIIGEQIELPEAPAAVETEETEVNVTRETAEAYAEVSEEPVSYEEECEESDGLEPVVNTDPDVISLRLMGELVKNKRGLKKYLRKSNKAVKRFNKLIADYEEAAALTDNKLHARNAICHAIVALGCVLEIRCDNLTAAVRIGAKKLIRKYMDVLYSDIERYNHKAADFTTVSGEQLTRVSAFLPEHLVAETGLAVIPVIGSRARYEQYEDEEEAPACVTFSFPTFSGIEEGEGITAIPTVTSTAKKKNGITVKTPVAAPLTEEELLGDKLDVTSKRKYKKLKKLAAKAVKKLNKAQQKLKIENEAELSVVMLALEREKVLVASRVLIGATRLGILKHVSAAKRELIAAFISYNTLAEKCQEACGTPVSTINSVTADKVAEFSLLPDMPVMLHVVELFETVGDSTRIVGESEAEKLSSEDCIRFIFGGAAAPKSEEKSEAASVVGGAAVVNVTAPAAAPAPAVEETAPAAEEAVAEEAQEECADEAGATVLSGKALKKYKKQSEKAYKKAVDELECIESSKYGASVGEAADIDVKYLAVAKNLIDALAEDVDTANRAGDKAFLKASKKRLYSAIDSHNAAVDELSEISGASLTKADKSLYDEIISGEGYTKMSKIEYRVKETTRSTYVPEDEETAVVKSEFVGSANRAMKVMNKKELKKFLKKSDKAHDALKDELKKASLQKKAAEGDEKIIALVKCLSVQKKAVTLLADKLVACCQVSTNKKQIDAFKRDLSGEISVYNSLACEYEQFTGDSITLADTAMADKIALGQPYSEIPDVDYSIDTVVYEYKYADFVRGRVKEENAKLLAKAQGHNRVEEGNAYAYEIATLQSRVAAQANKDQQAVVARFMFEKGLLQSDDDMYTYAYGKLSGKEKTKATSIEKRCKQLDKQGKAALAMERADNERYYKVVATDPNTVEIAKKKYSRADIIAMREQIMQLLNERDRLNGQLLSIYEGEEVDLDGRAITLEMRKVRAAAAAKEYKRQAKNAKKVKRLATESRAKTKLYDLINTQIQAESAMALANHRLKTETLTEREKKNVKRDIANAKKSKKAAEKQFRWFYKRAKNIDKDAGGSWLMGIGFVLLILIAALVGFMWFFGPDLWENVAKIMGN